MKLTEFSSVGLVGYWKLNEGVGSSTSDRTTNGNTGVLEDTTWVAGKLLGAALRFNGTTSACNCGAGSSLNILGQYSIEAWINLVGWGGGDTGRIVNKGVFGTSGYMFYASGVSDARRLIISNTNAQKTSDSGVLSLNSWLHVAVVYNGATARFYLNGVDVGGGAFTTNPTTATNSLFIGTRDDDLRVFNGTIDEVKIYTSLLAANEVARHFGAGRFVLPERELIRRV